MTDIGLDRRVQFSSGVFNVRDLGGLTTIAGDRLRRGVVFRADGLHRLPADEIEQLAELGVRTVVDLRAPSEVTTAASIEADGVVVLHLPVLREVWGEDAFTDEETADPVSFLVARYLEMVDEGGKAIAAVFELLATDGCRPLAFHCSAGKDRTGVIAALVLASLGVSDDDIAEDYGISAAGMDKLIEWYLADRPEAATTMSRQPAALWSCPPEAMHVFLARIRDRWGSIQAYLSSIGVEEATVAAVRTALL